MSDQTIDVWGIVEMMGHSRTAGRVTEEEHFGTKLGRVDVPNVDGGFTTVFFGGSALFRFTPCTEDVARAVARRNQPEPVHLYELPKPGGTPGKPSPGKPRGLLDGYGDVIEEEDDEEEEDELKALDREGMVRDE